VPTCDPSLLVLGELAVESVGGAVNRRIHVWRFVLADDGGALQVGHHLDPVPVLDLRVREEEMGLAG